MIFLLLLAFISGFLTVLSPCVLPVLPVVLASSADGKKARTNGVIAGIVVSFTLATLFLTTVVTLAGFSADTIRNFAAFLLFIIGVSIIFPIWDKVQFRIERFFARPVKSSSTGFRGGFATGFGLGIVWTPCVGPIVAAVSTLAAVNQISFTTVALVLAYALGLAVPLWFIGVFGGGALAKLSIFKQNPRLVRQIFGAVLVVMAFFVYSGGERKLQAWLLANLPEQWTQLAIIFEEQFGVEQKINRLQDLQKSPVSGGPKATVELSDLVDGCPDGRDCIKSIDQPQFESAAAANTWLTNTDTVFGVYYNGEARAYPQRILNWHEIVNDTIGGDPIVVTFCPLCSTGVAFERVIGGEPVEFGVSGKLYNSGLVMYDRTNQGLWHQATGEALIGDFALRGEALQMVPITTTSWERWLSKYPDTTVLSRDTGESRDYSGYYVTQSGLQDSADKNNNFQSTDVVYGVLIAGTAKAYSESTLQNLLGVGDSVVDVVGDVPITVTRTSTDTYTFVDETSLTQHMPLRSYWFVWREFYPTTEVFAD